MTRPTLITSLVPNLSRSWSGSYVGKDYQVACVTSWLSSGFKVISVNPREEIDRLSHLYPDIQFVASSTSGPPPINQFFHAASRADSEICGIINSDCVLTDAAIYDVAVTELTRSRAFLVGERVDVSPETGTSLVTSANGFDLFLFKPSQLTAAGLYSDHSPFRIGDPWWDYWFPLLACSSGLQLKRFALPVVSHVDHPKNWDKTRYKANGLVFRSELERLAAQDLASPDLVAFAKIALAVPIDDVGRLAQITYRWLWDSPPRELAMLYSDDRFTTEDYCTKAISIARLVQAHIPLRKFDAAELLALDQALRDARIISKKRQKGKKSRDIEIPNWAIGRAILSIKNWNRKRIKSRRTRRANRLLEPN